MKKNEKDITVSRALEMYRESEYAVSSTDFFSPGEKAVIYKELVTEAGNGVSGCFFWGGCRGAERCAAVFLPEWYIPENAPVHRMVLDTERTDFFAHYLSEHREILEEIPITSVRVKGSGFRSLTHRDFMGGILSLGIDRSVVGDIAVISESEAIVLVQKRIAEYITSSLTKIGRDGVKCETIPLEPEYLIPRRYEDMTLTVSSPRLDGIVKAITGKSRESSAELVRAGLVELSYAVCDSTSAEVKEGDVISVRGYGKFVIEKTVGETKSGRLKIGCKKYI